MHIDRRALLIGAGAVAGGVAIGAVAQREGWWEADLFGGSDPNAAISRVSRRSEAALIRAYDAALEDPAIAAAPLLARLQAYRDHHLDHLDSLGGGSDDIADAPAPGDVDPTQPNSNANLAAIPTDPAAIPAYFAEAEQQRAGLLSTGVRISTDGELARLLTLVVASETTHAQGWSHG